jgi:hypothetical protein
LLLFVFIGTVGCGAVAVAGLGGVLVAFGGALVAFIGVLFDFGGGVAGFVAVVGAAAAVPFGGAFF